MYSHDADNWHASQDFVRTDSNVCPFPAPHQNHLFDSMEDQHEADDDSLEFASTLDPLGERVLKFAQILLASSPKVTIKEVSDVVGLGETATRRRLNQLVHLKELCRDQGSGRTPSYYYLPTVSAATSDTSMLTDEQLLERLKQKEATIREQLESIQRDREALERVIELKRNFSLEG